MSATTNHKGAKVAIALSVLAMSTATVGCQQGNKALEYPAAPCDSTVYEAFGAEVTDYYRPLENDTSAATEAWVAAENELTQSYLSRISFREKLRERLNELHRYGRRGAPSRESDGRYYFSENDGTRNQSVIYRSDSLGGEAEVFLDPNALSDNGTVALTGLSFSKNGKYVAYTIARNGSDWNEIYVMDTDSLELLPDHIEWAKFTGAEWQGDGFYYSAYARPEAGKEFSNANEFHKVYYHRLGTPQSEDMVVYENAAQPLHFHTGVVLGDEQWLAVEASGEGHGNSLYIKNLRTPGAPWLTAVATQENEIVPIEAIDGKIYALTNLGAPRNHVVAIDPARPSKENWKVVIPEDPDGGVIASVNFATSEKLIVVYDRDASHHAYLFSRTGEKLSEIAFPTYGNAGFSCSSKSEDVFYSFSSFTYPSSIYRYDLATGESTKWFQSEINGFNPDDFTTEQVFYTSKDGTRVPMFIVRRNDVEPNGANPVYLYGYGGFNVPLNPSFSPNRLLWLENGGIYASANLRGGSEYGEEWHKAGTQMSKQNVFDDFIAAGEYMISQNWTTSDLLTIEGGSNGGLLVGAVVNQRPDLFKVAIPRVGVMDMMRYHLFTIGWNWAHDYGTADDNAEMAHYLLGYSPIHNISNDGTPYPAILVTTADHDDRVVPAHSFKYAATLQAANTGDAPKLIRIDSNAGHGAGKPISKVVDEYTDIYSFIYENLGINPAGK